MRRPINAPNPSPVSEGALQGLKVIELCDMVAGPFCSKLLGDLGADVIKIEKPGCGDESRHKEPFLDDVHHPERSGLFSHLNTNKLSITLDIHKPQGKKILMEILSVPGVVLIEDKSPQFMQQTGLSYDCLKQVSEGLIVTSITPFGQTGPYREYKMYPLNIIHGGGEGYCIPGGTEYINRPPLTIGRFVGDCDAGLNAAVGTLAALYFRNMTGLGQQVDISKQESVMSLYSMFIPRYANEGIVTSRANQGYPYGGILKCKDGYIAIIAWFERDWKALLELIGNPDWAKESRFGDAPSREAHGEEINALLLEWTMKYTKDEIYHQGQALGCAVGKVFTAKDLLESEHLEARQFFVEIEHPDIGKLKYPAAPYRFSETPWSVRHPAPRLGEHNDTFYCGWLGYTEKKLDGLKKVGVV